MANHQFELTLTEDVAAPAQAVFAHVTDFDDLARQLRARGARVERLADTEAGMPAWRVRIAWRGVERDLRIEIVEQSGAELVRATVVSAEFTGDLRVTVAACGPTAARLAVAGRAGGTTLPARMLLQSLRLGQGRIAAKLQPRLRRFCDRIARAAGG